MFFLKRKEKFQEVIPFYCQECGDELTNRGGLITENKKIYCGSVPWCIEKGLAKEINLDIGVDFSNSIDVQEAIKKGDLIFFNKLNL
jgi:phage host-nuclease inhibitor protein Gam